MAKGQVRSNKETRKPKAEKPKPAVSVGSSPLLIHTFTPMRPNVVRASRKP